MTTDLTWDSADSTQLDSASLSCEAWKGDLGTQQSCCWAPFKLRYPYFLAGKENGDLHKKGRSWEPPPKWKESAQSTATSKGWAGPSSLTPNEFKNSIQVSPNPFPRMDTNKTAGHAGRKLCVNSQAAGPSDCSSLMACKLLCNWQSRLRRIHPAWSIEHLTKVLFFFCPRRKGRRKHKKAMTIRLHEVPCSIQ